MKKCLVLVFLSAFCMSVFGQHTIGLKFNSGLSYLNTNAGLKIDNQKNYLQYSGQGGFYYNVALPKKFMFGTEVLFLQIEGKSYTKVLFSDNQGNLTGEYGKVVDNWHFSYLGIPVYFGYNIKKLNINLGFQINFALTSSGKSIGTGTINGESFSIETVYKKLNIESYNYGPRIGLIYRLPKRLSLEANYYYGINNVLKGNQTKFKWRIQQFTVGLRINLFNSEKLK